MPTSPTCTTYSSHRNLTTQPSAWTPPFLNIRPSSLPDFPCPSPNGRVEALRHKNLIHVVSMESTDPGHPLLLELASHKRLELIGDAFLRFAVYRILVNRYPELPTAAIIALCRHLQDNASLSWIAWYYGLFDSEILREARNVPHFIYNRQKPAADLFEAWLGAVSQEWKVEDTIDWLDKLFSDKVFGGLDEQVARVQQEDHKRVANRKVNLFRPCLGAEPQERQGPPRKRTKTGGGDRTPKGLVFKV